MADAHINDTAFVPASAMRFDIAVTYGAIGFVICYRSWNYAGPSIWMVPQHPPFGEVDAIPEDAILQK